MSRKIDPAILDRAGGGPVSGPINVTDRTPRLTRVKRPAHTRRTFSGSLSGAVLTVTQGAYVVETDKEGEATARRFDARTVATINVGDKVLVESKAQPGCFAFVDVGSVAECGWQRQRYVVNPLRADAAIVGDVWVMPTKIGWTL